MPDSRARQSGNVFFTLFGAVALVGVVGASTMTIMKGPVKSMAEVTKRTVAENNMIAAGRLSIVAVKQQTNEDCDADNFVEPLPWTSPVAGETAPGGGGLLPAQVGASRLDPWGTTFGYCSWDHGTAIDAAGCGGGSQKRLRGGNVQDKAVLAIISAGPDRVFQTSCGDAPTYVGRVTGSDDMILEYTYADSEGMAGGLWNAKANDLKTAEIDKNLEVKNAANTVLMAFDQTTDTSKPSLKVDFVSKLTAAKKGVELLSNIVLGTNYISADGDAEGIRIGTTGAVTVSGSGGGVAIAPRDGSGDSWTLYNPTGDNFRIYRTTGGDAVTVTQAGDVGIGTAAPTSLLHLNTADVGGNLRVTAGGKTADFGASAVGAYVQGTPGLHMQPDGIGTITIGANVPIQFGNQAIDKIRWYSTSYGTGIESSTLTNWSAANHRWRVGGTSVSTGAERMLLTNTALTVTGDIIATSNFAANVADSVGAPGYSWGGDTDTGMWRAASDVVGITAGGTESVRFYPTYLHAMSHQIKNLANPTVAQDAATKAYVDTAVDGALDAGEGDDRYVNIGGDTMTGNLWFSGGTRYTGTSSNNNFVIRTNNADRLTISAAGIVTTSSDLIVSGSVKANPTGDTAALPSYSWNGDTNTGMWRPGTAIIGFSTAGGERMRISSSGIDLRGHKLLNVGTPTGANDGANKSYVDTQVATTLTPAEGDARYVNLTGDTMTGNLFFTGSTRYIGTSDANTFVIRTNNANRITINSAGATDIAGALSVGGTATLEGSATVGANLTVNGTLNMGAGKITNMAAPTAASDAATKAYVDANAGGNEANCAGGTRNAGSLYITTGGCGGGGIAGNFTNTSVTCATTASGRTAWCTSGSTYGTNSGAYFLCKDGSWLQSGIGVAFYDQGGCSNH